MPYRQNDDGSYFAVRTVNRPVRSGGCVGPGCAPGMGAAGGPSELSTAARAALAAGARTGDRAARFAIEAVRSRGLGSIYDDIGGSVGGSVGGSTWKADHKTPDGTWVDAAYYDSFGNYHSPYGTVGEPGGTTTSSSDSGGGIFAALFGTPKQGQGAISNVAGQGIDAYRQFTGQGPAPLQAVQTGGGSSVGVIVGVVVVLGIGIAVALSLRGRSATAAVKANRRRRSNRGHRTSRYYVQGRRAA